MLDFRVLGPLEVFRGSEPLPLSLPSQRQRALVVRLLLTPGRVVPAEALVDAVWDHDPPRAARHALHTQISRARAVLGAEVFQTRPTGYLLDAADSVDAVRFESGVNRAAGMVTADPAGAAALLDELLGLWRGSAYGEFAGTFAQPAAVRLEELRVTAREHRAEALLATGAVDRAVGELGELVADHPIRERPHGLLMRALYLAGRQADALVVYQQFRERVRDELGIEPSPVLQQVHQQVLRQTFAPAPAPPPAPVPVPVPAQVTSFVGRDGELRALTELVGTHRLVTLVGPGGVGKTRLARELVTRAFAGRPVWWADLAPVREPADVAYRLVDALRLPQPAEREVEGFLVDKLRSETGLLVVDNCEQVIDPVARILAAVVGGCPDVTVLATSREPLAVAGERVLVVPPVPDSPAVALFADRLRAAGGPELAPDQAAGVREVCRRVGGLPLAIELAAARARSLGVAAIAGRPTLDLISGGRRNDPARHRSLRAVLDWSHDLLSSGERILLRRLAAFSGPFRLADAEQVCTDASLPAAQVAEALAGLVDKSMLAGPEQERYRMLDPTREYANEQLAAHGEDRWLGAAHARYFVDLAEAAEAGLRTPHERQWVSRLTAHIDELRAVHHWACTNNADLAVRLAAALNIYARYHMRFELQDWAAAAAALPEAADHPLRAAALGSAASGAWARGEFDRAERLARAGVAAADGHPMAALPTLVLGDIALLAGRLNAAAEAYQRTAQIAGTADPHMTCEALGGQAMAQSYQGDLAGALVLADASEQLARDCGAPGLMAIARYFAAECRLGSDPAGALELLAEARRLAVESGALLVVGFATLASVSVRARTSPDPAQAVTAYREAIDHWRRVGNRAQQWLTLRNLLPVLVRAGHHELALVVHGALRSAPVQLPADVVVPEAESLASAVAEAQHALGDLAARAASDRGTRMTMEDVLAAVLTIMETQS